MLHIVIIIIVVVVAVVVVVVVLLLLTTIIIIIPTPFPTDKKTTTKNKIKNPCCLFFSLLSFLFSVCVAELELNALKKRTTGARKRRTQTE